LYKLKYKEKTVNKFSFENIIGLLKNIYQYFHYPLDIKIPHITRWNFYYGRKIFYIEGHKSIFKSNKIFFKDEFSFFMFHNYIDLNFVKNSFMKIDLAWSFNLFFIYLAYYLFNYIVIFFVITLLFKKMKNIIREKKFINFEFFYNWQRLNWENYEKITNLEFKIFTNFYNTHYTFNEPQMIEEGELILLPDPRKRFDKWKLLGNNVRISMLRTRYKLKDKHDYFAFVYHRLYLDIRFFNINKALKSIFFRKVRSIRERQEYLDEFNFLVPFKYNKKLKFSNNLYNVQIIS